MKRIPALTLALLLLTSCGGTAEVEETAADETAPQETETETVWEPLAHLPEDQLDGASFTFLVTDTGYFGTQDILREELNGEIINDAVIHRNQLVEERLNVVIGEIRNDQTAKLTQEAVLSADPVYDAVFSQRSITPLAFQRSLYNLLDLPYLEEEERWWDKYIFEELTLVGNAYFATGDISLMDNDCTLLLVFNKYLIDEYDLPDPYAMVDEMTWTFDAFAEMSEAVSTDLDGDGEWTQEDRYGVSLAYDHINYYYRAFGNRYSVLTDGDTPKAVTLSEKNVASFEKLMELFSNEQNCFFINKLKAEGIPHTFSRVQFTQDQYLFTIAEPLVFSEFREMEHDFGILPLPLFDEQQERYYTVLDTAFTMLSVPISAADMNKCGLVLEAMAAQSAQTITPAYNETLLKRKYSRDNESEEMLDIISSTRTYDMTSVFGWGGLEGVLTGLLTKGSMDLVSSYAAVEESTNATIEKAMAGLTK
ncbi:MAG: hypothetical protein II993_08860 [Anaerotignum sp.]|nr:hypothetical protein [Anaerotignum sp.]